MKNRVVRYHALPAQWRFLRSRAQFAGLFGGIGSGKSHAGCFWAITKALRNPRCLGLVAANSYRQLRDATLRTLEGLLEHYGVPYTFRSGEMAFRLGNGAEILCRSMEKYDLLRGVELGWFYLDELRDTRFEAWCVVKGRLRSQDVDAREGRVTTSPAGFNWIYDEFVRKPADPDTAAAYANHEAFFARTADNHHLPPDYVAALAASYDPLLAEQELEGRFVNTAAGRVYHAFDRAAHLTAKAELEPSEPILWALDFNVTPMTCVIAQWDEAEPRGLRVVGELWLVNADTQAMCEAFGLWLRTRGVERPAELRVYGDAAGRARSTAASSAAPSDYAIIRQAFPQARLCVGAANPARRDRYNAVNAALRNAHGQARLRIHPRCRHLVEDLERLVYQPGTSMPDTSDPLLGHISDALGYLVARVMPAGRGALAVGQW